MKNFLIQLSVVGLVYTVSAFDFLKPGYQQFYNPIARLPWKDEAISLFSTTCKRNKQLEVSSQVQWIINFVQVGKPNVNDAIKTFGEPDCKGEKDGYTVLSWDSKRIAKLSFLDVTLRMSFDKESGNVVKYELLQ